MNTIDDEDILPLYRREQKFTKLTDEIDDMELSDEVRFRLFLIRVKTLQKYREICYNSDT